MASLSPLAALLRAEPILVTGMGCVSAAGCSAEALWVAAEEGKSPAVWKEFEMEGGRGRYAVCEGPDLEATRTELQPVRKADRCVQLAWLAAGQAWRGAQLPGKEASPRVGIMVGSSRGPLGKISDSFAGAGRVRRSPTLAATSTFASVSGALAQGLGVEGPGSMISAACASGAFAIGLAAEQILLGRADVMLAGGVETPLHPAVLGQFSAAGILGSHEDARLACRPFDVTRNGLVPGEGSAFLVLETARSAERRGVRPLCRLAGWSLHTCRSGRAGVPKDGAGLVHVMRESMQLAGMTTRDIGWINAHGSATVQNDIAEARAVAEVFGGLAATVPCSSTKPVTGHCLGATPALEAVISVQSLVWQVVPPSANCHEQDAQCPLHLPRVAMPARFKSVMSNSLGFWGYHASLVFSLE
ncbi:MAG TPA: beta-ketoacyl-[acyl-carrier-protein] synthase family protein [Verrucomicrobiales bacterium]|nr:beta-ketoacyl-[acyl-carrier-protein] synthase family protein [Verrucomicrobiales bacterium]